MADNIRLITFSAQTVKAVNDANVYEAALGAGGVKYGCVVTASAAASNVLHITAGNGVICGRAFEVFDNDIQVQLSGGGDLLGRVYLHLDLANTGEPIQIMTETGSSLTPPIQQEDVNVINGIYEIDLATFNVSTSGISNVENIAPQLVTRKLQKTEYSFNVTAGTQFSTTIPDYDGEVIEAYLNGLRLRENEYTISDAGAFTLTATLQTSGNEIQIVKWIYG